MTKFFKKSKKSYFGANPGPFRPNLGKNKFSWKKGSVCAGLSENFLFALYSSNDD